MERLLTMGHVRKPPRPGTNPLGAHMEFSSHVMYEAQAAESPDAFDEFFRVYYPGVVRFVKAVYPRVDAEDVAAATFATVWTHFGRVPPLYPRPWLLGVVRNIIRNRDRAGRREVAVFEKLISQRGRTSASLSNDDVLFEDVEPVLAAMRKLREGDQEILMLATWGELAPEELAIALGVTTNAATVRLHRARRRLRAMMDL